jgi:hypothetical protein
MPHCSTLPTELDVVSLSFSDTAEALELFFPVPIGILFLKFQNCHCAPVTVCLKIGPKLKTWW